MTCHLLGRSLDLFDPFDEMDLASHRMPSALQYAFHVDFEVFYTSSSFRFLHDPPRLPRELCPVTGHKKRNHTDKFRVTLDVNGYRPENLSVKVIGRKLQIDGKQEDRDGELWLLPIDS